MPINWSDFQRRLLAPRMARQQQEQELQKLYYSELIKRAIEKQFRSPVEGLLEIGKVGEALNNVGLSFQDIGLSQEDVLKAAGIKRGTTSPTSMPSTTPLAMPSATPSDIVPVGRSNDDLYPTKWKPGPFGMMGTEFKSRSQEEEEQQSIIDREIRKERLKQLTTARKELDKYSSDAMQSLVAINKIENHAKQLGDFPRGVKGQIGARISTGFKRLGKEEDVTKYLGVVAQELIPAARKLMEEKGPITEFDVARVEKGLGDITTPLSDKLYLLEQLRNKIRLALVNKMQVSEIPEVDFAKKYKSLYDMAFKESTKSPAKYRVIGKRAK